MSTIQTSADKYRIVQLNLTFTQLEGEIKANNNNNDSSSKEIEIDREVTKFNLIGSEQRAEDDQKVLGHLEGDQKKKSLSSSFCLEKEEITHL
jgi:hypothetical protein